MKLLLKIISLLFLLNSCKSTQVISHTDSTTQVSKELVGVWEFEVLKDHNGIKLDTVWHRFGFEIPEGPTITLKQDGTYLKQFTPKNIDTGKWYYDEEKQTIFYLLYYSKPYGPVAKDLIQRGQAKKDSNGDYYEEITSKVFEFSKDKLTLVERGNRRRTFRKRKE